MREARVIVTQAYSRLKNGKPGRGNEILAKVAELLHKEYCVPVLAQEEVGAVNPKLCYFVVSGMSNSGKSTSSWNTHTVAAKQAEVCRAHKWDKLIVVTFPIHMGRSVWIYERMGFKVFPAPMPQTGYTDHNLVHWTLRYAWSAHLRELLCRILFLLQSKI